MFDQMFVRYLGTKVCWTLPDGRFYIGDREEADAEEIKICDEGGGYLQVSFSVAVVAR